MEEYDRIVRETIKRVREEQNLTQAQLAERLGKHRQTVSRTETGKRSLELGEFFDWADALGISDAELFDRIYKALPKAKANAA